MLKEIRHKQSDVFATVTKSLGLDAEQNESFHAILESSIGFFDELLELRLNEPTTLSA